MVTETFDIVIKERGTDAIVQKIRAMGQSAKDASQNISALSSTLTSMPRTVQDPFRALSNSGQGVATRIDGIASSARNAITSVNNLARALQNAFTVDTSQAIAQIDALVSQMRSVSNTPIQIQANVNSSSRTSVGGASAPNTPPINPHDEMVAQSYQTIINNTTGAIARLRAEEDALSMALRSGALSTEAHAQAMTDLSNRMNETQARMTGMGNASGVASHHMANMSFQMNDVITSLASGQPPMQVFMQQGGQIAQIMQQVNGVTGQSVGIFSRTASMLRLMTSGAISFLGALAPLILVVGGVVGAVWGLEQAIQSTTKQNITMGDTVMGVWDTMVDGVTYAGKAIWDFAKDSYKYVTDSFADTGESIGTFFSTIGEYLGTFWEYYKKAFNGMVAVGETYIDTMVSLYSFLFNNVKGVFASIQNAIITSFEVTINTMTSGINTVIQQLNKLPNWAGGGLVGEIGAVDFSGFKAEVPADFGKNLKSTMDQISKNTQENFNKDYMGGMIEGVSGFASTAWSTLRKNVIERGQKREAEEKKGKGGRKGAGASNKKAPMTQEDYYEQEIKRLNDSVKAMQEYGVEKEALANVQKIQQQLAKKDMELSEPQIQAIKNLTKIEAERKIVHSEVSKLRETGIGQEEEYKYKIEAVNEAYSRGFITETQKIENLKKLNEEQARYNLEVGKGNKEQSLQILIQKQRDDYFSDTSALDRRLQAEKQFLEESYGANLDYQARMETLVANRNNMTEENFNIQSLKAKASLNQSNLAQGKGNLKDAGFNALFQSVQDYQGVLPELSQNFGAFFNQMSTGLSDSIAKIVTMQGGWEDMAKVGQQAITQLITGLIQLGIQYLLVNVLAKELGMSTGMGQQQPQQQGVPVSPTQPQVSFGGEQQNPMMQAQIQQMTKLSEANQKAADSTLSVTQNAQGAVGSITNMAGSMSGALQTNEQYSASLDNLGNVVISQFITSLAGMVAQWAAVQVAQMIFGQSTSMAVAAEAGAVAAAWAPAAAMASLATLGTNAVPAMTAIALTTGMSMALSAGAGMAGFESGGYTGNMGRKDVAGVVHGQEYVVNAQATRKNRPLLEAMNSGGSIGISGGGVRTPNITINNMGTPQNYAVESVTAEEVRLIARDQAEMTVAKRTPKLVSSHIKNPNSEISKALGNSTKTQRRRTG